MQAHLARSTERLIRLPEVRKRVGLGRSTIYRLMELGSFPKSRKLGARAIAWSEAEINDWIEGKLTNRSTD
ncbi:helix-turn-helix transcriptional regulator [Sphingomonas solaris]|uniref:AlpA family transcriptional regulator n=1 Tax=Alterirhizorhabdus solaris TaxID=2529389 RepID=A0A558RD36_9SPHN|nr:AlpA family transcriptional regulator [Sphingomonas solaris]TVV77369.1 AlpA family transcriptional regulator [Sphingomonas solaris]